MLRKPNMPSYASKPSKNAKNILIRIDTPSVQNKTDRFDHSQGAFLRQQLEKEILNVRQRVFRSKVALNQSRKQESSEQKFVESDRMELSFDHEQSKRKAVLPKIRLEQPEQDRQQTQRQEPQGGIQIPLHLQQTPHEQRFKQNRTYFETFNTSRQYKLNRSIGRKEKQLQMMFTKRSIQRLNCPNTEVKRHHQNVIKHANARKYRQMFGRSKDLLKYKQNLNKSQENKQSHYFKTQTYFLNQSHERLPIYLSAERSLSKQRKQKISNAGQKQKVKIRLNKPNLNQAPRYNQTATTPKIKPRYQIEVPSVSSFATQPLAPFRQVNQSNDWLELKYKIQKYQFVKKYLTEADLFMIYEHLKKNRIAQQKWPLFVVDEAYKKMSK